MIKANLELPSVDDLKRIEIVSPKVSNKYVPIFTSDLVKILAPEFRYQYGVQFVKGLSKHYVDLVNADGDRIRIYNSYDRTLALRVSLIGKTNDDTQGISIDLGIDRLIHIGNKAKDFTEDLKEAKEDIIKGVNTAKTIIAKLSKTQTTEKLAKEISDIIFLTEIGGKVQEYTNFVDVLLEQNITLRKYIEMTIHYFLKGEYTYTIDGVKKNGRKTKSVLRKVRLEGKIMKYIQANFPEYFL